jgi:hypothetical protein
LLHTIFIAIHAVFGGVAFFAGLIAIRRGALFSLYWWCLVGTMVSLAAAMIIAWGGWATAERIVFSALMALGVYMLVRGAQASRVLPARTNGVTARYMDDMGFNLIALFDAFVVVLVLDLGGAVWLMVTSGVGIAIIGHFVLRAAKPRLVTAG